MIIVFWIALLTLLLVYVGYPLSLVFITLFAKRNMVDDSLVPSVSVVIPVFNEEKIIEHKIENTLSLDYPQEKLEIIVVSDGSTDNTGAIVSKYLNKGVKFFEFAREGKLATLNRVFPKTTGEILVLTDASAMLARESIRKLTRHFIDPDVGVVSGVEKIALHRNSISKSESSYWNYETKIKELEGKIYSTVGANGPIYAIKRELFPSIPSHLNVCDDMTISLSVVHKGKRIILEPAAVASEQVSLTLREEWRRKIRIATRAWQSLLYHKNLLNPLKSPIVFPLIFHKVLRWLTFFFMLILFVSNVYIVSGFYLIFFTVQTAFYVFSVCGIILLWYGVKSSWILTFPSYFLFTNLAQIIGLYNAFFNKGRPAWQPIER